MRTVREAVVPAGRSAELIPLLFSEGIADPSARITGDDGCRLVPIMEGAEGAVRAMGLEIAEGPAHSEGSRPPMERIRDALAGLPPDALRKLPEKWETAGSTVSVKMDPSLEEYSEEIGRAFASALGKGTVLADVSGVSGELRRPGMRVLYGSPGESVKLENGIRYCFDATKVMFASGNLDERRRMGQLDCRGETVVDMFAGIGYFALPLARFAYPRRLFACEKNPDSYEFLVKNVVLNGVGDRVIPILTDNRSLPGRAFADRILMGYVQATSEFIPKALELAKPGCIIHYHDTFPEGKQEESVDAAFSRYRGSYEVIAIREVKSFAPGVSHYVADVRV